MNILLTCAGRRHYLVNYFRDALKGNGHLIGADMDLTAPALAACDRVHRLPAVSESTYIDHMIEIIKVEDVQMVFSLNDLEIELLSKSRERVEFETGAMVFVPDLDAFKVCADKWETFCYCRRIGIPTIPTFLSPDDAIAAVNEGATRFPMIVKPRWGSASVGLVIAQDEVSLRNAFKACGETVSLGILSAISRDEPVIIQEFLVGSEYGVDILFSAQCEYQGFAAKRKLAMRSGETDKAVTVGPDRFRGLVECIAGSLRHRGNLDCDFLEHDGQIYLLEMNPRFGGGYPFTHLAGANHVQRLIDSELGNSQSAYNYNTNLAFAKCDILVPVPSPNSG